MAVPSDPTWTSLVSAAMIESGRFNVSFTEVSNMATRGGQDVKTELWAASRFDALLASETVVVVTTGSSVFSLPADFDHEQNLRVYYGDGTYRGRAQTGNTSSITLQSTDASSDGTYNGLYIFTLANTGSSQYRQISQFTETTNIASVTSAWGTTPDSTTDYLIGARSYCLERQEDCPPVYSAWTPKYYRIVGNVLTVWPPPDKVYPILMVYSPNLTRIDETSTLFVKWIRERVSLIKQGIKVKTMALYDDDRYPAELMRWEQMKAQYGAQNPTYTRIPFGSR